jgi:hypothetical protein
LPLIFLVYLAAGMVWYFASGRNRKVAPVEDGESIEGADS